MPDEFSGVKMFVWFRIWAIGGQPGFPTCECYCGKTGRNL